MNCLKYLHLSGNLFIRKLITRTGIVITLSGVLAIAADSEHFTGEIVLGNGKFYSYAGQIVQNQGIVTKSSRFYDENGRYFLSESVTYQEKDYILVSLHVEDSRYGREQEILRDGNNYRIRYKESAKKKFSERTIIDRPLTMHGSYLPIFLSRNLEQIGTKGLVCRLLIVPRKMEIEVIIRNNGVKTVDGHACYEIQMKAANLVLKPLIKPHYFYFGVDAPHRLYFYRGTIQPTTPNGDAMWGTITLRYTAPENP